MTSVGLILAGAVLFGLSGLPGCLRPPRSPAGPRAAAWLMGIGAGLGLGGLAASFDGAAPPSLSVPWLLPWGRFAVAVDPLSALFLAPVFVVPALGAVYGRDYWKPEEHPENGRRLGLFYGLLAGAMVLVAVARDGVLFLIAWEIMAVSAWFASTAEDDDPEVRRAGWVYLVATHLGTLVLIAGFALWRRATGSFALEPSTAVPAETAGMIFGLAVIGFGFKAGLMPLHVWLPGAHANAPSHVSAVMSGVMLKMGVYGIVRMTALLPANPDGWGEALLGVGAVTGVAGIAFAVGQQDLKRLLAYSSIENIGIIAMGLGLALLGRSRGRPDWVMLGLGGSLLHVWNHALFKSLLFLNAGAVLHAAHTRDLDRLGGLAKRMPRTTVLFAIGAVALCALPPLNGFAGEWLLYLGLFRALGHAGDPGFPAAAAAAAALAMIGALAVACLVKMLGAAFLGTPRGDAADHAQDPPAGMLGPMIVLAAGCAGLGLFPGLAAPLLEAAARTWGGRPGAAAALADVAPLERISALGLLLAAFVGGTALALNALPRAKVVGRAGTWDCGYARPTGRMQYTASSFGETIVNLAAFLLWPIRRRPDLRGVFAGTARFAGAVPDAVLDRLVLPLFQAAGRHLPRIRVLQTGQTQLYVFYVLIVMIVLLVWGEMGVAS